MNTCKYDYYNLVVNFDGKMVTLTVTEEERGTAWLEDYAVLRIFGEDAILKDMSGNSAHDTTSFTSGVVYLKGNDGNAEKVICDKVTITMQAHFYENAPPKAQ